MSQSINVRVEDLVGSSSFGLDTSARPLIVRSQVRFPVGQIADYHLGLIYFCDIYITVIRSMTIFNCSYRKYNKIKADN